MTNLPLRLVSKTPRKSLLSAAIRYLERFIVNEAETCKNCNVNKVKLDQFFFNLVIEWGPSPIADPPTAIE
jgi:hypothetical protein